MSTTHGDLTLSSNDLAGNVPKLPEDIAPFDHNRPLTPMHRPHWSFLVEVEVGVPNSEYCYSVQHTSS